MSNRMILLWIYLIIINLVTFVYRGIDKRRAVQEQWRVSEKKLLILMVLGGGLGGFMGMQIWRHKTLKGSFLWKMYGVLLVWMGVLFWVMV